MRRLEMKTETLRYRKSEISAFYDINKRHKISGDVTVGAFVILTDPCPRTPLTMGRPGRAPLAPPKTSTW